MIYSTISTQTSKHAENKVLWAEHEVNDCKSTNLGFLFSMNDKANSKVKTCIYLSKGIWKELMQEANSLKSLD